MYIKTLKRLLQKPRSSREKLQKDLIKLKSNLMEKYKSFNFNFFFKKYRFVVGNMSDRKLMPFFNRMYTEVRINFDFS